MAVKHMIKALNSFRNALGTDVLIGHAFAKIL